MLLDLLVTFPSKIEWEEFEEELKTLDSDPTQVKNFTLGKLPKHISNESGKTNVYILHRGYLKGHMKLHQAVKDKAFTCSTTGREYSGNCLELIGPFSELKTIIKYKGFQGFRYMHDSIVSQMLRSYCREPGRFIIETKNS